MLTKKEATVKAKALKKLMKTKGWKIRVWENIGWHYSLKNGPVNLSEYNCGKETSYSCLIAHTPGFCGGLALWTEDSKSRRANAASKEPNACVARAMWFAWSVINEHYQGIKAAYEQLGLKPPAVV